jgi:diguanylate cyclase (GGDEF)-like protein
LPTIALRILQARTQSDQDVAELARLIEGDPTLAARTLRTINSPLYSLSHPVTSVQRALALIGLKPLRALVLGHCLATLVERQKPSFDQRAFWTESVCGAIFAREISLYLKRREADDDFTAAILRDIGVIVLDRLFPGRYKQVARHNNVERRDGEVALEREIFGVDHAFVGSHLLTTWNLSNNLTLPIRYHHEPEDLLIDPQATEEITDRTGVLFLATRLTNLLICPSPTAWADIVRFTEERFSLTQADLEALIEPAIEKTRVFCQTMEIEIADVDAKALLRVASQSLTQLAVESSVEWSRTSQLAATMQQEAIRWRRTAYRLKKQAVRDPLTGLYNRGFFEESLVTEFKKAERRSSILGLLFLDVDGFKAINDTHGHRFGDQVLVTLARTIKNGFRSVDIVARYGGDEFCVIAADTTPDGVRTMAERLLDDVRSLVVRMEDSEQRVAVSIGAVCCLPRRTSCTYEQFLAAADEAMYIAKTGGRDRVHHVSLISQADEQLLTSVRQRLFSQFLEQRRIGNREAIALAAREAGGNAFFIGRLARKLGWVTPRRLKRVLDEQRRTHELFGAVAERLGYLTKHQIHSLLAVQQENPHELMEVLVDEGVVEARVGKTLVQEYYTSLKSAGTQVDK